MPTRSYKLQGATPIGSDEVTDLAVIDGLLATDISANSTSATDISANRTVDSSVNQSQDSSISESFSDSLQTLDLDGLYVAPGYVELQVNGGWGIDLQTDPAELWELGRRLVEVGVTSFCPTLTSGGAKNLAMALEAFQLRPSGYVGAEACGWHLEGPWLNPERRGAHDESAIRATNEPVVDDRFGVESLSLDSGVALVTLAPEMPGAINAIRTLAAKGVVVSLGHSEATMSMALEAFEAGATMGTHLFNAMSGLHHRHPGLSTALLLEGPAIGLIADGFHVAPEMVDLAWRLAAGRIALVGDAVASMGVDAAGEHASSENSVARTEDGTIAGSHVGLDQCVRNLVKFAGAEARDAVRAASSVPASILGLEDRGRLAAGSRADLAVLTSDLEVVMTIVGGEIAYDRR